jgi:transcriptional regulator
MNEWAAYLPFCQSERQAQVISLRAQGMTAEKVAEVYRDKLARMRY